MSKSNASGSWFQRLRLALAHFDAGLPIVVKVALPTLAVVLAGGILLGWYFYQTEASRIRADFEKRALFTTQHIELAVTDGGDAPAGEDMIAGIQRYIDGLAEAEPSILLVNAYALRGGTVGVVASSDHGRIGASGGDAEEDVQAIYSTTAVVDEEELEGQGALEVSLPVRIDGQPALAIGLYLSTAERDQALAALLRTFLVGVGGAVLLVLLVMAVTFRTLVSGRLRRLLVATGRLQAGDYGARVEGFVSADAKDEMVKLAARFNSMAETIQRAGEKLEQEISERKEAEEAVRESEERIRSIIETSYEAFISIDSGGFITDWNRRAEVTFGWRREEVIGRSLTETLIPPRYREPHFQGLQRFRATGEGPVLNKRIEIEALHRDGHELPVELAIWPVRTRRGWTFSALVHDITERKRAEEALRALNEDLEEQATTDQLTGLPNRRDILQSLEREIEQARRRQAPLAAVVLDVDGFKSVNDRYGHAAGDTALRMVAQALRSAVRVGDVPARFGGDEFVVLLPDCPADALRTVLERIHRQMEDLGPAQLGEDEPPRISVSAGGALLRDGDTVESLLHRADMALFEAKRAGRHQSQVAA